jgi:hypothetical protein
MKLRKAARKLRAKVRRAAADHPMFAMGALVLFLVLGGSLTDALSDRSHSVDVLKSAPLYAEWDSPGGRSPIATVAPGEKLKVLRIRYGKDSLNIKVEREDGSVGWLVLEVGVVALR